MYNLNKDDMWLSLYKNRLQFLYKSISEYASIYENIELEKYINKRNSEFLNANSVEVFNSVKNIISENVKSIDDDILNDYRCKLVENENKFLSEINKQNDNASKVKEIKLNKDKFEGVISTESEKLLSGIEKIYNHYNQTMERIYNQGIKNISDRKAINIIELMQCYKNNLYKFFENKISVLIDLGYNLNFDELIGDSIINELDSIDDNISKYIFEKYINESQWLGIVESSKSVALECIDVLKRYELELCLLIKSNLFESFEKENKLLEISYKNIENIIEERSCIEKNIKALNINENIFIEKNKDNLNEIEILKKIIQTNYVSEYNRIVNLINNSNKSNSELITYFEYLYIITSEINDMEGINYE